MGGYRADASIVLTLNSGAPTLGMTRGYTVSVVYTFRAIFVTYKLIGTR